MKLTGGKVIVCGPGRNFVTLKLETGDSDRVFPHAYTLADGAMHPGDAPGLGVAIDEALAATFHYDPAYLPVARLADGTMHDW